MGIGGGISIGMKLEAEIKVCVNIQTHILACVDS